MADEPKVPDPHRSEVYVLEYNGTPTLTTMRVSKLLQRLVELNVTYIVPEPSTGRWIGRVESGPMVVIRPLNPDGT